MTPELYEKIYGIVSAALDMEKDQRQVYIDATCNHDPELQAQILRSIKHIEQADSTSFLESIPIEIEFDEPEADLIGKRIGDRYTIQKLIGRGGQGDVYLALRDEPYQETVAVKVLKSGLNIREILRRFDKEIRIQIALSAHPNIVRLLDAGETTDHRPYLVMEYIEGQRIDHYCDMHKFSVSERIQLFLQVCDAIKYAHSNLVVHRDLKPGNILVTKEGIPKLLDFGIARLLDSESGVIQGTQTLPEQRILTPEYASPEQFREDSVLTVAIDVYALGMILYELLTGHLPYQFNNRLRNEMRQVICEVSPAKPRTVIYQSKVRSGEKDQRIISPEEIGELRGCHPKVLQRQLSGDLETILMHALQKDPLKRFKTIGEFIFDLNSWLELRPPRFASRPTRVERVKYWLRRNPIVITVMALVGALVILGVLFTYESIKRREQERLYAIEKEARENAVLDSSLSTAIYRANILDNRLNKIKDMVNAAAKDPHLEILLLSHDFAGINEFLAKMAESRMDWDGTNLFEATALYDQKGVMLAHSISNKDVGKNFSNRDYIEGAKRGSSKTDISSVYISKIYYSIVQDIYKFGVSRVIRKHGDQGGGIGYIQTSIGMSQTMVSMGDSSYFKVILVGPWDENPKPEEYVFNTSYLIFNHPLFLNQVPNARPAPFPEEQIQVLKGGQFKDYKDPIYDGNWLAGSAPLKSASEYVVIVQVRDE